MDKLIMEIGFTPLFKRIGKETIEKTLDKTSYFIRTYDKGNFIISTGDEAKYLGIILKGLLEINKSIAFEKNLVIEEKKQGDIFGEAAVFNTKSSIYPCNLVAKSKMKVIFFNKEDIFNILSFDKQILNNFITMFANKTYNLNIKTELLSYNSIQEKIAFSIINILVMKDNKVVLPYSKKTWAEHLCVSRPSLSRELKKMSDKNLISIEGKVIKITDYYGLENIYQK